MGGGRKKKTKKKTQKQKNQERAKAIAKKNIKTYGSQAKAKAANQKRMKDAAAARHAKFKQTRVQTYGGKKTSFSKAEQKRITDAGYSVSGYSKSKPNVGAGTAAMVKADNAQYGNTVPAGSFGISAAGRKQAEANRAAAARKVAAQKSADQKRAADARRASAEKARRIAAERAAAEAARKAEAERKRKAEEKRQRQFDPTRLNPDATLNDGQKIASSLSSGSYGGYVETRSGAFVSPEQAQKMLTNPGNFRMSPADSRYLRESMGLPRAEAETTDSSLVASRTDPTGLGISTKASSYDPGSTAFALQTGNFDPAAYDSFKAGGLNIGSTADSAEDKPKGLSRVIAGVADAVMRDTTDFDKRGVGNPASFGLQNTVAGSVLNAAAQETGTINQFRKDTANFSNLKNFNKLSNNEKVKTAQNVLKFTNDSQAAQALGEGLGLGKDFKSKINNAVDNVQGRLKGVTADRDSIYGVTSDFARDIDTDPDLNPINKFLTATATNNLGEAGKEKNILGMTNEMARDIKAAFQDDSPTTKGLNKEQRGYIEGGLGNRILSGKATDGLREATYGYGGREGATNAGLTEGQPLNFSDILNTASAMKDNLGTDTTLASQRFDEAKRLIDPSRGITTPSLIKGLVPRLGSNRGGGGTPTTTPRFQGAGGGGVGTPVGQVPQIPTSEELLPLPVTPAQTGMDSANLAAITQNAYNNQMSLYGVDPNYFAQFRQPRFNNRKRFRQVFNRGYF